MDEVKPNGFCWCGCETAVGKDRFFSAGHDKFAEGHVTLTQYGSVAAYIAAHGYGPGGKNARLEANQIKGAKMRFFVQLTVRSGDPIDPNSIAADLTALGGVKTGNGFGFTSRGARDSAFQAVASKYGDLYVSAADTVS